MKIEDRTCCKLVALDPVQSFYANLCHLVMILWAVTYDLDLGSLLLCYTHALGEDRA